MGKGDRGLVRKGCKRVALCGLNCKPAGTFYLLFWSLPEDWTKWSRRVAKGKVSFFKLHLTTRLDTLTLYRSFSFEYHESSSGLVLAGTLAIKSIYIFISDSYLYKKTCFLLNTLSIITAYNLTVFLLRLSRSRKYATSPIALRIYIKRKRYKLEIK